MNKNALTTIVGILLILYAVTNFGACIGQFAKGKAVSGTASMASSLGNYAGDRSGAAKVQREGSQTSAVSI